MATRAMMERRSKPEAEYTGRPSGEGAARLDKGKNGWGTREGVRRGRSKAESSECVKGRRWDGGDTAKVGAEERQESKSKGAEIG